MNGGSNLEADDEVSMKEAVESAAAGAVVPDLGIINETVG